MLLQVTLLSCLCLGLVPSSASIHQKLRTIYEWDWIDYLWDSEADRVAAIKSGDYNYTKPVVIDVDVWKDGRIFVTVIRQKGVPASLTTISHESGNSGGPLLKPYPDWSWAKTGDCNGITSVYRVAIDECDRLWVLDTGVIGDDHVCPAQLLVFDLDTDRLLKRIKIPDYIARNAETHQGLLVTPIVDTEGYNCEQTYVYMADVDGRALVVYNGTSLWRLESIVYYPEESAADNEIAGETYHLNDGVLGMALSPRRERNQPRFLLFRAFASYDMVSAETWNLRSSYNGEPVRYTLASGALPSPAVAMAFSSQGILFFGLTTETALACWNIDLPITNDNIVQVVRDRETIQFASGLKVIGKEITGDSEELWMVTNRFQKVALGTQNFKETNFRILTGRVDDLIAHTNCAPRPKNKTSNDKPYLYDDYYH